MNTLEQIKNEQFIKEQFIKGRILDDTKDYGRTQFVDEIYTLQQEIKRLHNDKLEYLTEYAKMSSSQDKFIKYLEVESREIYRDGGLRQNIFRQVLQKYKEITGVSNGKES